MSSIFGKMKKLFQNEDDEITVSKTRNGNFGVKELGSVNTGENLKKLHKEQQMKQKIFDRIHTVIDEYGGLDECGLEFEKILSIDIRKTFSNSRGIEFLLIPSGNFMMGSDEYDSEKPVHKVTIKKPFYLGKYPVTQKQWTDVMGNNPSHFKSDNRPVECVSWNDAQVFIKKINNIEGTDKYRLPSEAEWEYACRAGTGTKYSFGDDESKLGDYACYDKNSSHETHPVEQKKANPWGLYDMHGNVWEWVKDSFHDNYEGAPSDRSAWESEVSPLRVGRGGSWLNHAGNCRSANRGGIDAVYRYRYLGFRLSREL